MTRPIRILAFSDLHGKGFREASSLIDQQRPDWIVLCGDLLPDFSMVGGMASRLEAQKALVLCGQVHEAFGSMECGETLVVNAACGYALLEWKLGTPTLLEQARLMPA